MRLLKLETGDWIFYDAWMDNCKTENGKFYVKTENKTISYSILNKAQFLPDFKDETHYHNEPLKSVKDNYDVVIIKDGAKVLDISHTMLYCFWGMVYFLQPKQVSNPEFTVIADLDNDRFYIEEDGVKKFFDNCPDEAKGALQTLPNEEHKNYLFISNENKTKVYDKLKYLHFELLYCGYSNLAIHDYCFSIFERYIGEHGEIEGFAEIWKYYKSGKLEDELHEFKISLNRQS